MKFAWRIYRWLAQAFPHEFKLAYGREVMQLGEDVVDEIARRHGLPGLLRLIADIAVRVPLEYLSEMRRDVRYALRALRKSPGFALVGVISMGLGIGLTTVVYSSEWQLISREIPAAANASRLVMAEKPVSYYYVERYREQKTLFSGVAAFQTGVPFNVIFPGEVSAKPERIFGQLVSADYFSVLGVAAQRGRTLSPALDKSGDPPVVVISDRFWRHHLNSSPDAVGQTLRLNGHPATIVGIAPKDFDGALALNPAELFVPITVPAALAPELGNDVLHQRHAREFLALMSLAPGITLESAEAALDVITRRLDRQDSAPPAPADKGRLVTLLPAGTLAVLPRNVRRAALGFFLLLMGLIMALVCMNLANMALARGINRRKELAIRLAVGASRFRLVRQMLSEGILLALLGGAAGFALAYWLAVLNAQLSRRAGIHNGPDLGLDWRAAFFVFALAIACGIGFSLLPALRATKADLAPTLKQGSSLPLPVYRRLGLRNLLMVVQVAGSLMLLLITGFLVIGISKASDIQTNFDPRSMYLLSIDPVRDGYSPQKAQALFEQLPGKIKSAGSIASVALAAQSPFPLEEEPNLQVTVDDLGGTARVQKPVAREVVGAGYFAALSEPMVAGREFVEQDQRSLATNALPVVLNQSAARGLFGTRNPIGARLREREQSFQVVGVVRDLKNGLGVRQAVLYLPLAKRDFARPPASGMTIMARTDAGAGADALRRIRGQISALDPNLTIFNVQTLGQYLDASRSEMRFAVRTYGGIGLFGLVLAAIGLAGVTGYAVAQRRKEIGIRTALGATRLQVLRLVLREGVALVTVGTALGFLAAIGVVKILAAMTNILVEALKTGTNDPRLLAGAPLLLAALALLACYLPARAAARIDPLRALREE